MIEVEAVKAFLFAVIVVVVIPMLAAVIWEHLTRGAAERAAILREFE